MTTSVNEATLSRANESRSISSLKDLNELSSKMSSQCTSNKGLSISFLRAMNCSPSIPQSFPSRHTMDNSYVDFVAHARFDSKGAFFKLIKQNLTVEHLLECSENVVMIHLWTAIITDLLLARAKALLDHRNRHPREGV